jgi:hypothetical protein
MNKTTDKTKTPQQTKTGEQTPDAAPATSQTETQPAKTEGPPTVPAGSEPPKDREYTRNVEERPTFRS